MLTRSRLSRTISLSTLPGRRNHPMLLPRPIITTSRTVAGKCQLMLSRCGTYAMAPLRSAPWTVSEPCAIGSKPAMASKSVLLPAPFGPRMPISVPGPASNVIPVSARCPPRSTDASSTTMRGSEVILDISGHQVQRIGNPRPILSEFLRRGTHGNGLPYWSRSITPQAMRLPVSASTSP